MCSVVAPLWAQNQSVVATPECPHDAAWQWLQQQGHIDQADNVYPASFIACVEIANQLIIARLSPAANSTEQERPLDLHLYRLNHDAELVTQAVFPRFSFDDATGPQQLSLQPNRYRLAPQATAIGLRVRYSNQGCRACEGDWQKSELHLFLVRAKTFNWIVRQLNVAETSTQQAANSANCVYAGSQLQVRLKLAKTRHAGLADLLLYVQQSTVPGLQNYGGPACPASKQPTTHQLLRWHYNGQQYQGPQPTLLGR